jgi:hypothetical protein
MGSCVTVLMDTLENCAKKVSKFNFFCQSNAFRIYTALEQKSMNVNLSHVKMVEIVLIY